MAMTFKTKINQVTDVEKFVNCARECRGEVTVSKGKYVVDGKSILGILSVDPSTEFKVKVDEDDYLKLAEFDRSR